MKRMIAVSAIALMTIASAASAQNMVNDNMKADIKTQLSAQNMDVDLDKLTTNQLVALFFVLNSPDKDGGQMAAINAIIGRNE
jgi:opacity protein-like surface antigen